MARKPTRRATPSRVEPGRVTQTGRVEMMATMQSVQKWQHGAYSVRRHESKVLVYYAWSNLVCHADLDDDGLVEHEHYNDYLPSELDNAELHETGRKLLRMKPWLWSDEDERSDREAGGRPAGTA